MTDHPTRPAGAPRKLARLEARRPPDRETLRRALAALDPDGILEVCGADPTPADATALASAGIFLDADASGYWRAGARPLPSLVDLSDREPPEPFVALMEALDTLPRGAAYLALLPRFPVHLLPHLERRAALYAVSLRPDGRALVWLRA